MMFDRTRLSLAMVAAAMSSAASAVDAFGLAFQFTPSTSRPVTPSRGNGSARVQRAAVKRRNIIRNRRAHR